VAYVSGHIFGHEYVCTLFVGYDKCMHLNVIELFIAVSSVV